MARTPKKTRPRGACSKAAGDESRRTAIQCTLVTPHTHPARSLPTPSPALTPFRGSNGIFAYAACLPAASLPHVPCFSRSPLARPLPCVDRSIGERNLTCLRALPAQLMELTTHYSDCAPTRSSRSPLARPLPCVDRSIGERNLTCLRALPAQLMELTTHYSVCAPARSSRSPLARPLPYVHRTIGERNFTEPLALPAQLMDLASYCRDCTSAHALALSHHVFPFYSA